VLLNEGKVAHYETELGLTHFKYRFGNFKIMHASPVTLEVENVGEGKVVVNGNVTVEVKIPCARCLELTNAVLDIQLETESEQKDYIDGYNLDVDQLVHDEALSVWPERVLCREDCKGLCSTCGQNLNDGSCDCERTDLDPRMAKILDIFSNFKEV
jgi:uncharacterized protein